MARPPRLAYRGYPRGFDWVYRADIPDTGPGPLIPVIWDGLWLNPGEADNGLCAIVTSVTGWLDSAPANGNDVSRVISDGAAWGPKVLGPRTIVIDGKAAGPRPLLGALRDLLAVRAAARDPAELAIGDHALERVLVADVRAGTDSYRHQPLGPHAFRWSVTLTAADPALYAAQWQEATLTNLPEEDTGRDYPRDYPWRYASPFVPNTAQLANDGNHPAPVFALYEGDLSESAVLDDRGGIIRLAALEPGVQILVNTATLAAEAPGGLSRASFILPGSRPITIPAGSSRWYLRSTGRGSVTLAWRSTFV
jgi:hypothetical protein